LSSPKALLVRDEEQIEAPMRENSGRLIPHSSPFASSHIELRQRAGCGAQTDGRASAPPVRFDASDVTLRKPDVS
jgi:hypothetical protein